MTLWSMFAPTEKTARTWKISSQSPGGRILYEELSGGVSGHNHSASHEECLKCDDTKLFLFIMNRLYLATLLIVKVAAAKIVSAL